MLLRIYADFNSTDEDGWCWCLRHDGRLLDDCASELQLKEGMSVVLYYADDAEEFEFDGVLSLRPKLPAPATQWNGRPDFFTYRHIRGVSNHPTEPHSPSLGGSS